MKGYIKVFSFAIGTRIFTCGDDSRTLRLVSKLPRSPSVECEPNPRRFARGASFEATSAPAKRATKKIFLRSLIRIRTQTDFSDIV